MKNELKAKEIYQNMKEKEVGFQMINYELEYFKLKTLMQRALGRVASFEKSNDKEMAICTIRVELKDCLEMLEAIEQKIRKELKELNEAEE